MSGVTSAELIGLVSGSSVVAAVVGAWATRKAARAEVEISRFEAITNALDARIEDLKDQLDQVRRDLAQLRDDYEQELDNHRRTRSLLMQAIDHIRAWMHWSSGERTSPPPKSPADLGGML